MTSVDPVLKVLVPMSDELTCYIADTSNNGQASNKEKKSLVFRLRATMHELILHGPGRTHKATDKKEKKQEKKNEPHIKTTLQKFWHIYKEGHENNQNAEVAMHEMALIDLIFRLLILVDVPHHLVNHHAPQHPKIDWEVIIDPTLRDLNKRMSQLESTKLS